MKYKISVSEDGTYISIRVLETITGEIEKEFAKFAIKEAKQRKIRKFLVDVRGTRNIANSSEQYLLGYEDMKQFDLDKHSRIAVLVDENDNSHNFIETIMFNAGYLCSIFIDEDAALEWLG